jgi:hypothetical protein
MPDTFTPLFRAALENITYLHSRQCGARDKIVIM